MKNFLIFVSLVFIGLFAAVFLRSYQKQGESSVPVLKVFGSASFTSQWGPGPLLKEEFEKSCDCRVEFYEGADSTLLFQRVKAEGRNHGADLVLGFDQYDLEMIQEGFDWKKIEVSNIDFFDEVKPMMNSSNLVAYDWGVLAFVFRHSRVPQLPNNFEDLLKPEFKGLISLEDPRTSSAGLQFLLWLIRTKGEEAAFSYLKKLNAQLHSYSPSWSGAYGLFTGGQVLTTFSYVTSPVYHLVEEKDSDVVAPEFTEGHPIQVELMGIPATCKSCELADRFAKLILSKEGQKIVMEKNYMFPVVKGVKEGTVFSQVPKYRTVEMNSLPSLDDRERILKKWSQLRRAD